MKPLRLSIRPQGSRLRPSSSPRSVLLQWETDKTKSKMVKRVVVRCGSQNRHLTISCPWQAMEVRIFSMIKKQFRALKFFPEPLNCFLVFFVLFFTHFVWNYLVVKMRFERPTCCIGRETFYIQISCSNSLAISPAESSSTSYYTTPF